jgi:glycine/D-amino acid oxidase-like deaminating enzyme
MGVEFRHGSVVGLGVSTAGGSPAISTVQIQLPAPNTRPSAEEQRQRAGAQVSGPQTEERTIELGAGSVVNAAGAFAAQIVRMGGAHLHDLPVRARKRTMFSVQCGASDAPRPAHDATPLVVDPSGVWFRPDGAANRFLCGMSPPAYRGDPDCSSPAALRDVDHALFDDLIWPALYNRCDAFAALRPTSSWAGFYENNTLDANAIIGRHPQLSNLVLCNGFSGHGLQQAPGAGRAVAELLTTARYSSIDVSCFGFERVQRGEPLYEQNIV